MDVMPHTRTGWLALGLLVPVLLYPLYWSVFLLLPDALRQTAIVVIALGLLALASLVTAGVAILRDRERSVLLIAVLSATVLLIAVFAVGEAVGH